MASKTPKVVTYTAKKRFATSNELHSKWGWYKVQQYYRREFLDLLEESPVGKFTAFSLTVKYNSKHDCDNLAPIAKFFVDTMRELKVVKNDTKAYYKSLTIKGDKSLPKWTIEFTITPEEYGAD